MRHGIKADYRHKILLFFVVLFLTMSVNGFGAAPPSSIDKAKQEAEARGYLFIDSHEKIVAAAKKEGKMRALSGLDSETIKAMVERV